MKSQCTVISVVTCINDSRPSVCSRNQAYYIYFDLSNEEEFVHSGD
jgi:hypothetical protein